METYKIDSVHNSYHSSYMTIEQANQIVDLFKQIREDDKRLKQWEQNNNFPNLTKRDRTKYNKLHTANRLLKQSLLSLYPNPNICNMFSYNMYLYWERRYGINPETTLIWLHDKPDSFTDFAIKLEGFLEWEEYTPIWDVWDNGQEIITIAYIQSRNMLCYA